MMILEKRPKKKLLWWEQGWLLLLQKAIRLRFSKRPFSLSHIASCMYAKCTSFSRQPHIYVYKQQQQQHKEDVEENYIYVVASSSSEWVDRKLEGLFLMYRALSHVVVVVVVVVDGGHNKNLYILHV